MSLSGEFGYGVSQIPDDDFQMICRGKELHVIAAWR
jgi:hypothetical protein